MMSLLTLTEIKKKKDVRFRLASGQLTPRHDSKTNTRVRRGGAHAENVLSTSTKVCRLRSRALRQKERTRAPLLEAMQDGEPSPSRQNLDGSERTGADFVERCCCCLLRAVGQV